MRETDKDLISFARAAIRIGTEDILINIRKSGFELLNNNTDTLSDYSVPTEKYLFNQIGVDDIHSILLLGVTIHFNIMVDEDK